MPHHRELVACLLTLPSCLNKVWVSPFSVLDSNIFWTLDGSRFLVTRGHVEIVVIDFASVFSNVGMLLSEAFLTRGGKQDMNNRELEGIYPCVISTHQVCD